MDDAFFRQAEQNIVQLIHEKKYKEAYSFAKQFLERFPHEKTFIKLKEQIEEAVEEENESLVNEKLQNLKPLYKEEKYEEILKGLKELLILSPNSSKLQKLYQEAQIKYQNQVAVSQEKFEKKQRARLDELLKTNETLLIEEIFLLETQNSDVPRIRKLAQEYRDKVIEKKIKEKGELIYSDKYDAIANFLEQLRHIDKENPRIAEIENITGGKKLTNQSEQKSEYIYAGQTHLDTLMKLKKYDKVMTAAEEILKTDPNNETAKNLLEEATQLFFAQTREESIDSINKNLPALKQEYKEDKTKFTTI
ncbi:MAG: hypothetical protein AAB848_00260 [Patescibacteria group bacterium]